MDNCFLCELPLHLCSCAPKQKRKYKPPENTKKALDNYYQKQIPKTFVKRYKKPEKKVERDCMDWMKRKGWDMQVYEAKAVFNPAMGRWCGSRMKAGTVDSQGLLPNGNFACVEFKAPGRRATFNAQTNTRQKEYLLQKINFYAFGCVVDSVELLEKIYNGYEAALKEGKDKAKEYLFSQLP